MLTSGQIAMQMAQQNQGFAGNQAFSQQISQGMPGVYGGGAGGGQPFNYGGGMSNQSMGTAIGDRAMNAGAGMARFGAGLAGTAAMGNVAMGTASAVWAGGGMAAMGAGAVAAAPIYAGMKVASHVVGSTMAGARQQAQVDSVMGGVQLMNTGTSGQAGGGVGRSGSMAMGNMMRQMSSLPEMMTSMGELTRIMDKMNQNGMMQGTQNVAEFGKKFKDNIKVLKDMAKVMGSSMEEALPMFGELRRSGFYSTGDIMKNAMGRQITGGVTGMSQNQVAGLASAGSQMSFQTGGSRKTGANLAMRTANQLGMANQMGILTNDQIMEYTGQEGAAGIQAMSQQLTHASYRMMKGAPGTVMSLAMGAQEDGKYTGEMDQGLVSRMKEGEFTTRDLMRMARKKSRGRGAAMSYVARKKEMRSEMAGQLGVEGQFQMLQNVLGERGFKNPDAMRIVSQRFGLSEREADLMVNMGGSMDDIKDELKSTSRRQAKEIATKAAMRDHSWDAVKTKAKKRVSNAITKPFEDLGADIRDSINGAVEDFVNDVTGEYTTEVTKSASDLVKSSLKGDKKSGAQIRSMLGGGQGGMAGIGKAGTDFTSGFMGATMDWMAGGTTAGEDTAAWMKRGGLGGVKDFQESSDMSIGDLQKSGYNILTRTRNWVDQDDYQVASKADVLANQRHYENMAMGGKGGGALSSSTARLKAGMSKTSQAMLLAAQTQFDALSLTASYGQDLTGKDRLNQARNDMRKQGGGFAALERESGLTSDELLSVLAEESSYGGLGIQDALAEGGRGQAGGTIASQQVLAENTQKAEEALLDKMKKGGRGQEMLAALKGNMGGAAGGLYASYLGAGEEGDILGYDSSRVTKAGGSILQGTHHEGGVTITKGKLSSEARGLMQKIGGFGDMTKDSVSRFVENAAVRVNKPGGKPLSQDEQDLLKMMPGRWKAEQTRQSLEGAVQGWDGDISKLSDAEKKALVVATGKNEDDITDEDVQKVKNITDSLKTAGTQGEKDAAKAYLRASMEEGIGTIANRFKESAGTQANKLRKFKKEAGGDISATAGSFVDKLTKRAAALRGANDDELSLALTGKGLRKDAQGNVATGDTAAQEMGDIAAEMSRYALSGDKDERETRSKEIAAISSQMGPEGDVVSSAISARKRLRKGGRGVSREALEAALGEDKVAAMIETGGYREKGGKLSMKGKGAVGDDVVAALASGRAAGLHTGAGAESGSTKVNPAEIANSMEKFAGNVANLATVVATLQKE